MRAYYNDSDPFKCEVIREAIKAGAIAPGDVDERSIADVEPVDLMGYIQCHFFGGGGFWSLALRQAGWPDDREVWTGSCPCPSFSAAGKGQGFADPRHLWPHWARLIRECHPSTIFGEQVSAAIGHGWLDLIQTDLEAQDYAVGKAVFGACSVGAPHIRQRLYFVANSLRDASQWRTGSVFRAEAAGGDAGGADGRCTDRSEYGGKTEFVAQSGCVQEGRRVCRPNESSTATGTGTSGQPIGSGANCALADTADARRQAAGQHGSGQSFFPARSEQCGNSIQLADTIGNREERSGTVELVTDAGCSFGIVEHTTERGCGIGGDATQPGNGGYADGAKFACSVVQSIRTGLEGYSGNGDDRNQSGRVGEITTGPVAEASEPGGLANSDGGKSGDRELQRSGQQRQQPKDSEIGCMADTCGGQLSFAVGRPDRRNGLGPDGADDSAMSQRSGPVNGWWAGADWIGCRDGKFRPVRRGYSLWLQGIPEEWRNFVSQATQFVSLQRRHSSKRSSKSPRQNEANES